MCNELVSPEYLQLLAWLQPKTRPWRRLTIAVDGVDHAGKSTLARFLAWQLKMPVIETDFFLLEGGSLPQHDADRLLAMVDTRHKRDRPVIVEGVFVLRQLAQINVNPEVLIRVQCKGRDGSGTWQQEFATYIAAFPRAATPDYRLIWDANEAVDSLDVERH